MYAIIKHGGKQYKVSVGDVLDLDRIEGAEPKQTIEINDVLLVSSDETKIGNPTVDGAKVVLEVLEAEQTINEIASKYELLPANVKNWKKMFLENMSLAFDKSTVVKEYKAELETVKKEKDMIAKKTRRDNRRKGVFGGKAKKLGLI